MGETPDKARESADFSHRGAVIAAPGLHDWFVREVLPLEAQLMQFLRRTGRNKSDMDDLLQDIYVRVCEAAAKQRPHPVRPFVFAVARNLLIDRARREHIVSIEAVEDLDALNIAMDAPGPDQNVMAREELRRVQAALDRLPPRARQAVILRKVDGLSWREIAAAMGITEKTVNHHITDAMRALADMLYGEPPGSKP